MGFLLLVSPRTLAGQAIEPLLEEVERYALRAMQDWNVPGMAIAVVKDGRTVYARGFGLRELGKDAAVDADTLFAVASNSKSFTTAGLAMMVDEGRLKWDDPVSQHLPGFRLPDPVANQAITVRDLVCHRSGYATFSGDLLWYETDLSRDDVLARLRLLPAASSFRGGYGYQNLMYIAAGRVLENVSGLAWGEFMRQRILEPLGMASATVSVTDVRENMASPHNESGGTLRRLPQGNVDNAAGACGINASAAAMARWLAVQLGDGELDGERIFSREQAWEMHQPQTIIPVSRASAARNPTRHFHCYGLGWFIWDFHGRKVLGHGGGLDGMISQTAFVPEEGLGIVVLTNSESPVSSIVRDQALEVFFGRAPRDWNSEAREQRRRAETAKVEKDAAIDAARKQDANSTIPPEQFAGIYLDPMYGEVIVEPSGSGLVMRFVPAAAFVADLEHWHYNTFLIRWRPSVNYNFPRGFVTFSIDAEGRPDRMEIDQPNDDFWFYELNFRRKKTP